MKSMQILKKDFRQNGSMKNSLALQNVKMTEKIINKCDGKSGKITKLETKEKSTERPLLYSLDTLQKDANRIYGYGAAEVLDIAQSLYETQKLITYPRTDSNYLSSEMKHLVPGYIDMISTIDQYKTASEQLSEQDLRSIPE